MMEQRSESWFAARLGKVTASRIADVVARTRSGWGASRMNYEAQLIAERLTGTVQDAYSNAAMKWGTETEPLARAAYEFHRDVEVVEIAFVDHPKIPMAGASPDGLVGDGGMVELKCPTTATHIETLLGGSVPDKYVKQCQWQMACTGRKWNDWASFDPRLPESMRLIVHRIERDDKLIAELEKEVREFLAGVDAKVQALLTRYEQAA